MAVRMIGEIIGGYVVEKVLGEGAWESCTSRATRCSSGARR
jgi:hypothetical protein